MTRPIPYPAKTLAKGWRFELNMETVKKSDTWLRAKTGFVRAHLLLLWSESWEQTPCGSLPNDDELLALLLDMDDDVFAEHKRVLMRGWWLAEDGRLYHDTITERVLAMLDKRASDAQRAANRRAKLAESAEHPDEDTPESRVTPAGLDAESGTSSTPSTKHQVPKSLRSKSPPTPRRRGAGSRFEDFWLAWPKNERKQDKAKCLDHWKLHDLDAVADAIVADVRTKRGTEKWQEGYIEAPLVYLRGKRWEDGVEPNQPVKAGATTTVESDAARITRMAIEAEQKREVTAPRAEHRAALQAARDKATGKVPA